MALVAVGKVVEAQNEIDSVAEFVAKSQSRSRRLEYEVVAARVLVASGHATEVKKRLDAVRAEATKYGFVGSELEARLTLGEIAMRSGGLSAGGASLAELEQDARARGFLLIAHKAGADCSWSKGKRSLDGRGSPESIGSGPRK